jgi:hypothetical protein
VTSQGSLRHEFQRALERGSAVDAISAAKAMGGLSLGDALALCVVMAERSPAQFDRAASRWVSRFLEETPDASLEEVQLITAALAALPRAPALGRCFENSLAIGAYRPWRASSVTSSRSRPAH